MSDPAAPAPTGAVAPFRVAESISLSKFFYCWPYDICVLSGEGTENVIVTYLNRPKLFIRPITIQVYKLDSTFNLVPIIPAKGAPLGGGEDARDPGGDGSDLVAAMNGRGDLHVDELDLLGKRIFSFPTRIHRISSKAHFIEDDRLMAGSAEITEVVNMSYNKTGFGSTVNCPASFSTAARSDEDNRLDHVVRPQHEPQTFVWVDTVSFWGLGDGERLNGTWVYGGPYVRGPGEGDTVLDTEGVELLSVVSCVSCCLEGVLDFRSGGDTCDNCLRVCVKVPSFLRFVWVTAVVNCLSPVADRFDARVEAIDVEDAFVRGVDFGGKLDGKVEVRVSVLVEFLGTDRFADSFYVVDG